jgi:hypothetical protein
MINVTFTFVTPERGIGKAESNGMLGGSIVSYHMGIHVSGALETLTLKADPVFTFIIALSTCKLREVLRVYLCKEFH